MDLFFRTVTWGGSILTLFPLTVVVGLLLMRYQRTSDGLFIAAALCGSSLITHLLKLLFARERPSVKELIVNMPTDFSFPSAHTAQVVAFSLGCAFVIGKYLTGTWLIAAWLLSGTAIFLVGYSRIYLKVHYVSDVLAGAALSCFWLVLLGGIMS